MDRKRIQCWSNASQHVPIYLQPFLRYSDISVASDWFLTVFVSEWAFLPHFASPGYVPGTIEVDVTRLERGYNACKTPRCIYPSIFILQPFLRYSKLLVENCHIFIPHLCLAAPRGWPRRNFAKILIHTKLEWMGYHVVKKAWQYVQPFWYSTSVWRMDRRTDRCPAYIYYVLQHSWRT